MKTLLSLILILILSGCTTTGDLPGIIGGQKGSANWCLSLDVAIIDPISICFKGKRESEDNENEPN